MVLPDFSKELKAMKKLIPSGSFERSIVEFYQELPRRLSLPLEFGMNLEVNKIERGYRNKEKGPVFMREYDKIGIFSNCFISPQYSDRVDEIDKKINHLSGLGSSNAFINLVTESTFELIKNNVKDIGLMLTVNQANHLFNKAYKNKKNKDISKNPMYVDTIYDLRGVGAGYRFVFLRDIGLKYGKKGLEPIVNS